VDLNLIINQTIKFRNSIRNYALNKENNISKESKQILLGHCDQLRDDFLKANVEFKVLIFNFYKIVVI
jgi:hypothetical protein